MGDRPGGDFGAVVEPELGQYVLDMVFRRTFGKHQCRSDFLFVMPRASSRATSVSRAVSRVVPPGRSTRRKPVRPLYPGDHAQLERTWFGVLEQRDSTLGVSRLAALGQHARQLKCRLDNERIRVRGPAGR